MSIRLGPSRFRFLAWLGSSYLLFALISRFGLMLMSWPQGEFSTRDLLYAYGTGLLFDIAALSYLLLPFTLWLAIMPMSWRTHRLWRPAALLVKSLVAFSLLLLLVCEWVFWAEFSSRFNFIAVDYLVYTNEVIGNIEQSYPTALWLACCTLLALLWVGVTHYLDAKGRWPSLRGQARWPTVTAVTLLCTLVSFGLQDNDRQQRKNHYANELAGDGLFALFGAFRNNQLDYQRFYPTLPLEQAARIVKQQLATPDATFLSDDPFDMRRAIHHAGPEKRLNLVLITVESLSANFLGALGDHHALTPELDRLASQGMLFTNLYATGNRTVRGLEALSLAVPPTPGQSIVRRPDNENLFTLGGVFQAKGYQTHFLYGGYGTFDNMNAYFAGNHYQVMDRLALKKEQITQENVWGVADEDLYNMALRQFDQEASSGKPFFAHLMTTSNHRPYSFPEQRVDLPQGHRDGAVKYTDWAIGQFIRQAQQKPWARDTLFVIVADHCASSAGKTTLPLSGYQIPMIIWSPAHVQPQRVDRLMSQMDVAPTLLGLLNFNYVSQFLGQDVFATEKGPQRAFIATYQAMGYLKEGYLSVLTPLKAPQTSQVATNHGQLSRQQHEQEAIAWYEYASTAFSRGWMKQTANPAVVASTQAQSDKLAIRLAQPLDAQATP
ncbi:MAG: LTA synthase family protein [Aeromonadaceae bacterium]